MKSFHPKHGSKTEYYVEGGSNWLGVLFKITLIGIVVIWLCQATSAGLMTSLSHEHFTIYLDPSTGFWPLDAGSGWL